MMFFFFEGEKETNRVRVAISVFGCSSMIMINLNRLFTQTVMKGKDKNAPQHLSLIAW